MPLSTPHPTGATLDSSTEGITGTQSVPFTFTLPNGNWEFIFCRVSYQADPTVISRFVGINIEDNTGAIIQAVGGGIANANQLRVTEYITGVHIQFPFGNLVASTFPQGLITHKDWTLNATALNFQASDTQIITFQFRAI